MMPGFVLIADIKNLVLISMQGSWIVRQSVGSTPCLLGKAVDCNYIRGPKYLEVRLFSVLLELVYLEDFIIWWVR